MTQITDISPTSPAKQNHSVTGRMLSIACSPDGSTVFVGSYSNLWASNDGGQNFTQLTWPQPSADQYFAPGALGGWCAVDIAVGMDSSNRLIILALMAFDQATIVNQVPVIGDRGIWRSADGGATWTHVHQFSPPTNLGQLEWAQGSDHLVYASGGTSLGISQDAGATFVDVFPFGKGTNKQVNHVAVWLNAPADSVPKVIYALGTVTGSTPSGCMALSFDGGTNWTEDQAAIPGTIGGATNAIANSNSAKIMAISPLNPLQVYITANGGGAGKAAVLCVFDYSAFPSGSQTAQHLGLALPGDLTDPSTQDSGNVFVAVTRLGQGDLIFYGAQRSVCYVASLDPNGIPSNWHALDSNVHYDLHGLLLSPDFSAFISNGAYSLKSGTAWLLSDGGIYRSIDGGQTFFPSLGVRTLSAVNIGGAAIAGSGPALSLNTGDNDGFYSLDGGRTWTFQQYGGGDDDCSFADPLRPYSMFVCTPRWNGSGDLADHAVDGQTVSIYETTPGSLPNASTEGTSSRHVVTGPLPIPDPLPTDSTNTVPGWNSSSPFYLSGYRPIVLGLAGEELPAQGDYVFVLNPMFGPALVRSQSIFNISSRDEWKTTATEPIPGANVFLQGPPLPAPTSTFGIVDKNYGIPSLGAVQASGGHASTVFYVGGDGTLRSWQEGQVSWKLLVPATAATGSNTVGVNRAIRFFVSPYLPNLIYVLDMDHVKRSDDGGETWIVDTPLEIQLTWNEQILFAINDDSPAGDYSDLLLTDMKFDPNNPLVRFAVGKGGAFYTVDGSKWTRLLHTGALPGHPCYCYYDPITNPADPALYVAFAGRGVVRVDGFDVAAAPATVVPTSLTFAETQVGTTSLQQTVTVFAGSDTITGISILDVTQGGSADFASVPPPGERFTVVNGQLVITVWFTPKAGGPRKAALEIAHQNDPGNPLRVELSGTGNPAPTPLLSVSPTSLFFTPKKLTNHKVTLTNTGNAPLFILSITIDEPNFSFTTSCPVGANTLSPGQQCTVTVGYHFIGPGGSANLIIAHDAPGSPTIVGLDATSAGGINP
jgi:hypothetical protein